MNLTNVFVNTAAAALLLHGLNLFIVGCSSSSSATPSVAGSVALPSVAGSVALPSGGPPAKFEYTPASIKSDPATVSEAIYDGAVKAMVGGEEEVGKYFSAIGEAKIRARDGNDRTVLHFAAHYSNVMVVKAILGVTIADIDLLSKVHGTPLMYASRQENVETVEALLGFGAKIGIADKGGATAIMLAVGKANAKVVDCLLSKGADVNTFVADIGPLIGFAARLERKFMGGKLASDVVKVLIKHKADLNKPNSGEFKYTPLHLAVFNRDLKSVQALVNAGANINLVDIYKRTAWDYADKEGAPEFANMIISPTLEDVVAPQTPPVVSQPQQVEEKKATGTTTSTRRRPALSPQVVLQPDAKRNA